jgi:hypothetical protein
VSEYMTVGGELTAMERKCIRITELETERDSLQAQLHEVREVYIGMDGGPAHTLEGKYLMRIIKQMYTETLEKE